MVSVSLIRIKEEVLLICAIACHSPLYYVAWNLVYLAAVIVCCECECEPNQPWLQRLSSSLFWRVFSSRFSASLELVRASTTRCNDILIDYSSPPYALMCPNPHISSSSCRREVVVYFFFSYRFLSSLVVCCCFPPVVSFTFLLYPPTRAPLNNCVAMRKERTLLLLFFNEISKRKRTR